METVPLLAQMAPPALPELLPVKETSLFSVKEMPTLELAHMAPPLSFSRVVFKGDGVIFLKDDAIIATIVNGAAVIS